MERQIVPMTLQILLENAIKHNVLDSSPFKNYDSEPGTWLEVVNTVHRKEQSRNVQRTGAGKTLFALRFYWKKTLVKFMSKPDTFLVRVPLLPEGQAPLEKAA